MSAKAILFCCLMLYALRTAAADDGCGSERTRFGSGATLNLRIDNDLFGGLSQDQGYSNGFLISMVSPNLVDYIDDPCLPGSVRRLNRYLSWLRPEGYDDQNMTIGLGQMMYTPIDNQAASLIEDDRPYAGALMLSMGYNARHGDRLRASQLRIGMIGPTTRAEQTQTWWHDLIGSDRFHGWHHQLRDEPVLQLIHERHKRVARHAGELGWGWDVTRHWGASLGNFATYANVGSEWRWGFRLPDDFGTAPLRPAGENTAPVLSSNPTGWNGHVFVAIDARWVLYDVTLDGNTFKSSHSVDKHPLVADFGYGIGVYRGYWRFAFARYHRSREFKGQHEIPVYGTFTFGRRF